MDILEEGGLSSKMGGENEIDMEEKRYNLIYNDLDEI